MPSRRRFVQRLAWGAAFYSVPGLFAEQLYLTPKQTEGPYYPDHLPLDVDNDLLVINDSATPAVGEITHLTGRISTPSGAPIRNAVVEIWQVDNHAVYRHSKAANQDKAEKNFQGFGRFETGSTGEYRFRTIKPPPYTDGGVSRTRHIHFAVNQGGKRILTTQLYVKGEPLNETDTVLKKVKEPRARESIIHEFRPVPGSKIGELAVSFDLVIGVTPEDS